MVRKLNFLIAQAAQEMGADRALYFLTLAYTLATACAAWYSKSWAHLVFVMVLFKGFFTYFCLAPLLVIILWNFCIAIFKSPMRPAYYLVLRLCRVVTPKRIANYLSIMSVGLFFGSFMAAKNLLSMYFEFSMDRNLAAADAFIFGSDAWRIAASLVDFLGAGRVLELLYGPGWMVLILAAPPVVLMCSRFDAVRKQFILSWCLCWILLGNVLAAIFMSAGPGLYGAVTGDYHRFGGLNKIILATKGLPFSAAGIQSMLWENYINGVVTIGGGISAFPSLHVSMATLLLLVFMRLGKAPFVLGAALFLIVLIGSVYLGWHYAVDGLFSVAATIFIWKTVGLMCTARSGKPIFKPTYTFPERAL